MCGKPKDGWGVGKHRGSSVRGASGDLGRDVTGVRWLLCGGWTQGRAGVRVGASFIQLRIQAPSDGRYLP